MKALQLIKGANFFGDDIKVIDDGIKRINTGNTSLRYGANAKYRRKVTGPQDDFSWKRVMNGVKWGALAGGIGTAGYMANS